MDGCLVVYKPMGYSSHDVVSIIRKRYSVKCGHAGTLDPMAQGVLLIFINKALKLINFIPFQQLDKTYLLKLRLGITTDTYDSTGKVTGIHEGKIEFTTNDLMSTIRSFVGTVKQVPPAYSAIKINGKRAYDMARAGKEFQIKPREVKITSIRLVRNMADLEKPELILRVHCSRGTYIRSLAHDIGQTLRCGAHLTYLLRERVGKWPITNACSLEKLKNEFCFTDTSAFCQLNSILSLPVLKVNSSGENKVRDGRPLVRQDIAGMDYFNPDHDPESVIQIFNEESKLIALYNSDKSDLSSMKLIPSRVLL